MHELVRRFGRRFEKRVISKNSSVSSSDGSNITANKIVEGDDIHSVEIKEVNKTKK